MDDFEPEFDDEIANMKIFSIESSSSDEESEDNSLLDAVQKKDSRMKKICQKISAIFKVKKSNEELVVIDTSEL